MSGADDNLFARWSRRKQEIKAEEAPPDKVSDPAPAGEDQPAPDLVDAEPAEPLPRIEDLTGESDVAAFLRKGVPEALQRAALRKMWSLDPFIRDYTGLAEYAWDYNKPGAIPGFGPASSAASTQSLVASMARASADPERAPARVEPQADPAETDSPARNEVIATPSEKAEEAEGAERTRALPPLGDRIEESGIAVAQSPERLADNSAATEKSSPGKTPQIHSTKALPTRHGRAVPR